MRTRACVCVWIIIADNTFERESEIILKMVLLLVKLKGIKIFIHQEMVTRNVNYVSHLSILHWHSGNMMSKE